MEQTILASRRLLLEFVKRELRTRYAGSAIGVFWSVIHPLVILLLYILVFSALMKGAADVKGHTVSYALFLCPAIIAWNWLNESLMGACTSVTNNAALIKKVVFPSSILPAAAIMSAFVPFAAAMIVYLFFATAMGAFNMSLLIYLPLVVALQLALVAGPAYFLASLNVFIRDTAQILTAALQFLFWGTPIVYREELVTNAFPWMAAWYKINPVAHLVAAYRDAILAGQCPNRFSVAYLLIISAVFYLAGRTIFIRGRHHFADEV